MTEILPKHWLSHIGSGVVSLLILMKGRLRSHELERMNPGLNFSVKFLDKLSWIEPQILICFLKRVDPSWCFFGTEDQILSWRIPIKAEMKLTLIKTGFKIILLQRNSTNPPDFLWALFQHPSVTHCPSYTTVSILVFSETCSWSVATAGSTLVSPADFMRRWYKAGEWELRKRDDR